jgi:hypothetical protein
MGPSGLEGSPRRDVNKKSILMNVKGSIAHVRSCMHGVFVRTVTEFILEPGYF